ncbi:MAG: Gfo/Idh/MocA family protein [Bacillota bacterium]
MRSGSTRREFLKSSTLVPLGVWLATRSAFAQSSSPAEKLNIACIGTGGRAADNIRECRSQNIVALCDVDENTMGKATTLYPKAKTYTDFRKMLEQKDIDAVLIGTPDHTHAVATMAAIQLGKHVYCEKPLTHTVWEARQITLAAARAKVATQMGTQIHATENYRRVVELLRAGAIGTVRRIHVWVGGGYHGGNRPTETPPVPAGLHWDLWLGPAPYRPYHSAYHPFAWRGWWDFGGGTLADMACHHMDLSHWAFDLRHPTTVEPQGPEVHPDATPKWLVVDYHYPARGSQPPIHLTWYNGDRRPPEFAEGKLPKDWPAGSLFIGDKGMLLADYNRNLLLPEADFKDYQRPPKSIPASIGHHNEWIKACKEGTPTTCNFAYAGPLTETVLLGNIAYRSGQKLQWDPATLTIPNAPSAAQYLRRDYRNGWSL